MVPDGVAIVVISRSRHK